MLPTDEEVAQFHARGYLRIPELVGPKEIARLRAATAGLIGAIDALPARWRDDFKYGALLGDQIPGGVLCRLEYTLEKHPQFMKALGHPGILATAAALKRAPLVLTWEDMVLKLAGGPVTVPWHQDTLWQSLRAPVFSMGIYLDDSHDDPLRILPGTQVAGPLEEDQIPAFVAGREKDIVEIPAKAGDVIVHNVLAVHGSELNRGRQDRRVLYFEFRSLDQVENDSPWNRRWLERRLPYVPAAVKLRRTDAELAEEDRRFDLQAIARLEHFWMYPGPALAVHELDLRVDHDPATM